MERTLRPRVAIFGVLNLSCVVVAMKLRSWKLITVWIASYVLGVALSLIFPELVFERNRAPRED